MRISDDELRDVKRVVLVAAGTSHHAALIAKYAIERWARLGVDVDISSEYRYRDPDRRDRHAGDRRLPERRDDRHHQATREAQRRGARVVAISNIVDSSLAREADAVIYTRAGLEVSVASTKAFVAQVAALELLALRLAQLRGTLPESDIDGSSRDCTRWRPGRHGPRSTRERREVAKELMGRTTSSSSAVTSDSPPRSRAP
jgi:glutamine---fructose-6-phosphate transaminase (isomerizing)